VNATLTQVHAILGLLVVAGCVAFAILAWLSVSGVGSRLADGFRVGVAGLAVVAGAIGLAVALRGHLPGEWLQCLSGAALVVVPVVAGVLAAERSERGRSVVLAITGTLLIAIAWRAMVTG
jgi:hypothetical protein